MTNTSAKRIFISGASSGIGRALSMRMAKDGHTVIASARRHSLLSDLALEAANAGLPGKIIPFALDVTDRFAHRDGIEKLESDLGAIDMVICNAGYYQPTDVAKFNADEVLNMMNINFNGVIYMLDAVLPKMIARRSGHVAIVASVAGYSGLPNAAAYGASKAALINLSESLHNDLKPHGVHLQVINPGFVKTPLTDKNEFNMPFLIEADAAVEHIARGLQSKQFEIKFPAIFAYILKFLRILPYGLYLPLVRKATKRS